MADSMPESANHAESQTRLTFVMVPWHPLETDQQASEDAVARLPGRANAAIHAACLFNKSGTNVRKLSLRLKHLSQEHQAVMHFVAAMREVQPESENHLGELAKRIRSVFATDLEPHFAEEERYALPRLREIGRPDLADEVFRQHEKMRALAKAMVEPTTPMVLEFIHMLQGHVELEDNVVWEAIDRAADQTPQQEIV